MPLGWVFRSTRWSRVDAVIVGEDAVFGIKLEGFLCVVSASLRDMFILGTITALKDGL